MATKIDITRIVKDHFKTLNISSDWYFFVLPLFISFLSLYLNCRLDKNMVGIINTGLSIFVGLFFNVIIIIFDTIRKNSNDPLKNTVLKQTLINISFLILNAILGILFAFLSLIENEFAALVGNFVVYFLVSFFFLTVLMVLKRVYALFITEIDEEIKKG